MSCELRAARRIALAMAAAVISSAPAQLGDPGPPTPRCLYTIIRPEIETQLDDACAYYRRCSGPEECRVVISGPGGDVRSCGTPGDVLRICIYYRLGRWNPFTGQCEGGTVEYSVLDGYVPGFPNWSSCQPI